MRLEILIQFIVPLTFLAIWALTSILNRDAQPLPPRPGRPQGAGGGRPMNRLPGQFEPRPDASVQDVRPAIPTPPGLGERPTGLAGSGLSTASPAGLIVGPRQRPLPNMDDAIVYIENDPASRAARSASRPSPPRTAPQTAPRSPRIAPQRRGTRGRTGAGSPAGAPGRTESEPHRVLSDQLSQTLALQKTKPLEITPLGAPITPLSRPLSEFSAATQVPVERGTSEGRPFGRETIRMQLATPTRLREIAVLSEILQPPLALRSRSRRH
jgi:hypothetical protein